MTLGNPFFKSCLLLMSFVRCSKCRFQGSFKVQDKSALLLFVTFEPEFRLLSASSVNQLLVSFVKAVECRVHPLYRLHYFSVCTCIHLCSVPVCSYGDLTDDPAGPQTGLAEDVRVYLINNKAMPNKPAQGNSCFVHICPLT